MKNIHQKSKNHNLTEKTRNKIYYQTKERFRDAIYQSGKFSTIYEKAIATVLLMHINRRTLDCWIGVKLIAREASCCKRKAQDALAEIEDAGFFTVTGRSGTTNLYEVGPIWHQIWSEVAASLGVHDMHGGAQDMHPNLLTEPLDTTSGFNLTPDSDSPLHSKSESGNDSPIAPRRELTGCPNDGLAANDNLTDDEKFDQFWNAYPEWTSREHYPDEWKIDDRLSDEDKARFQFRRALKKATFQEIMDGVARYVRYLDELAYDEMVPVPATWLDRERWTDELDSTPSHLNAPRSRKRAAI